MQKDELNILDALILVEDTVIRQFLEKHESRMDDQIALVQIQRKHLIATTDRER